MEDLISINRRGLFSLEQARRVLPIVRRITEEISGKVDALISELETTPNSEKNLTAELEEEINILIQQWNDKIKKLGAIPKGLWLVDFEFGRGHYCWKFPETDLQYWHTQDEGYSGRRPLEELGFEKQKEKSPHRSGPNQRPSREL